MSDTVFVAGAYVAALGALGTYAATLIRRLRAARAARAAVDRRTATEAGARIQPQVR